MIINRNSLDFGFLKSINALEDKYQIIIQFEYVKNDCIAHCFSTEFQLIEIATIKVGTRSDTKERWHINLSKELKRQWS